jgi:hypothetical protein
MRFDDLASPAASPPPSYCQLQALLLDLVRGAGFLCVHSSSTFNRVFVLSVISGQRFLVAVAYVPGCCM